MAYFTYDTSVIIARKPLDLRAKSSRFLAGFSSGMNATKGTKTFCGHLLCFFVASKLFR